MSSDIIREIDFSKRGIFQPLTLSKPFEYLRPCWVYQDRLFVWCDEHLRWNEHGASNEEKIPGTITSRVPHHRTHTERAGKFEIEYGEHCDGVDFYCLGDAPTEVAKIVRRYPGTKAVHTPPPIRRVYPSCAGQA
jgi:hypothetical protein